MIADELQNTGIMFDASRDSNSSEQGRFSTSTTPEPTAITSTEDGEASDSLGSIDSYEDIEGDVDFHIRYYLCRKQKLLEYAANYMRREQNYSAWIARHPAQELSKEATSIWSEAKEILSTLQDKKEMEQGKCPTPIEDTCMSMKSQTLKHPLIDTSCVHCLSSKVYGRQRKRVRTQAKPVEISLTLRIGETGQWMAKALALSIPSSPLHTAAAEKTIRKAKKNDINWKLVLDPVTLGSGLMLPAARIPAVNAVDLCEAINITGKPQLVTQSAPPFAVVHANKAFALFSGIAAGDIIGKPVESFLQLTDEAFHIRRDDNDKDKLKTTNRSSRAEQKGEFFQASILLPEEKSIVIKTCKVCIVPVTDRSRCLYNKDQPNNRGPQSYSPMTHVLIKIQESTKDASAFASI